MTKLLQCPNCFAPLPPPGSGHATCRFCGATSAVASAAGAGSAFVPTRAASDPHGAQALAMDFHREHGVDLTKDKQAMDRLGSAWTKAWTELRSAKKTEINLPFLTATPNGPLHYQREVDERMMKLMLAVARKRG